MGAEAPPTSGQLAEDVLLDAGQRRKLFTFAASRFGIGDADAEDLLQETALQVLLYRSYVRSPEGFVFAVFRARCARFIQERSTQRRVFSEKVPTEATEPAVPECCDEQMALREAFGEISSSCRRLLRAYYIHGQSLREAARTMSLAYSSMAKTISRCLRKLRECLT
jgi:RNA polymerase sigma factor (sigma-70 family)